ncbi:MAG: FHA domain-containing protein [Anaerolineales bacterium]|nr:FHA domain-containing protein [Anaerolineales bacterium]
MEKTQTVNPLGTQDTLNSKDGSEETLIPEEAPVPDGSSKFMMQVLDIGENITFKEKKDFTLGRAAEGQPLIPEIDLNAYNAYEQGVSRMHAVISIRGDRVTITDLGSANGTWVNGDRVSPHTARVLNHGDLVTLGKFRMQALIRS